MPGSGRSAESVMAVASQPSTLAPDIRAFLDALSELIAEDLLRQHEGQGLGPLEPDDACAEHDGGETC
jgi:hypothetical protein